MLLERAKYPLSSRRLSSKASMIHCRTTVLHGIKLWILGNNRFKSSKNTILLTKAKGIWQITKKAISAFLNGSSITLTVRLAYCSATRSVDVREVGKLSAAASACLSIDIVFLGVFFPCSEMPWTCRRWSFLLAELAEENAK